jgi:hypothetical protein
MIVAVIYQFYLLGSKFQDRQKYFYFSLAYNNKHTIIHPWVYKTIISLKINISRHSDYWSVNLVGDF